MKPEAKTLVDEANRLLAIWQEQERANQRSWDEDKSAHAAYITAVQCETSTAEEIRAAYKRWRDISNYSRALPDHYDVQRDWAIVRAKAQLALCEDARLLRSDEEKRYDEPEPEPEPELEPRVILRHVPDLDESGQPRVDPDTGKPMEKVEVDWNATIFANPKIAKKALDAVEKIAKKMGLSLPGSSDDEK
jgi:hypothetical protein